MTHRAVAKSLFSSALRLGRSNVEMRTRFDAPLKDCHVYVRPEGNHFVGLCAELQEIITARTVDEIVARAKVLSGSLDIRVELCI